MEKKDPIIVVVLSLVTCGIYHLIWAWNVSNALEKEVGAAQFPPILQVLFPFLLGLSADDALNKIREKKGQPTVDNKMVYLLLGLFFYPALDFMIQTEINKFVDEAAA